MLLEAGDSATKYDTFPSADRVLPMLDPNVNRGYKTIPQQHVGGRELDYSRGIGLGGSSIINFQFWTTGAKGDYEEWAERVGDDSFNWENAQRLFKRIENYHLENTKSNKHYISLEPAIHGSSGAVDIEFTERLMDEVTTSVDEIITTGIKKNLDLNSGDPIGIGIAPNTSRHGYRVTAKTAYLDHALTNLTIMSNHTVHRLLLEGNKAIGVVTNNETCK